MFVRQALDQLRGIPGPTHLWTSSSEHVAIHGPPSNGERRMDGGTLSGTA